MKMTYPTYKHELSFETQEQAWQAEQSLAYLGVQTSYQSVCKCGVLSFETEHLMQVTTQEMLNDELLPERSTYNIEDAWIEQTLQEIFQRPTRYSSLDSGRESYPLLGDNLEWSALDCLVDRHLHRIDPPREPLFNDLETDKGPNQPCCGCRPAIAQDGQYASAHRYSIAGTPCCRICFNANCTVRRMREKEVTLSRFVSQLGRHNFLNSSAFMFVAGVFSIGNCPWYVAVLLFTGAYLFQYLGYREG